MNRIAIKYFKHLFLIALLTTILLSCDEEEETSEFLGNWQELSDFEGVPRNDAVGFSIGNKGYVGTGYDGDDRLNDFWEYDADKNYWVQKADFPGTERNGAVGFGTDTKGYIGTGYDGSESLSDFWEYNPLTNTWSEKADFAGSARYGAVGFAINNKGYIGTGYDGNALKDFYEYDPTQDIWTKIISMGGSKRMDAIAFVINGKAYVGTGLDNGIYEDDLWEFDPELGYWTEKREIANNSDDDYDDDYSITRTEAIAFTVNNLGYVATGGQGSIGTDVWEYDPINDIWEEKTELEAVARMEAVAFSIGNKGYITTGRSSSYRFDDLWSFEPFEEQVDND